eukprot:g6219.t1
MYGGSGGGDATWKLNLTSLEWKEMNIIGNTPGTSTYHTFIHYEEKVVVYKGGIAWVLDLSNKTYSWEKKDISPRPASGQGPTAVVYHGEMIVYGGGEVSDVWALNLTNYTWRQINTYGATSTLHQRYHTATLHDNMMVVYGGWGTGGMWSGSTQLRALDLRTGTWIKINASAPQPLARYDHSAISYNRKMVVFGGANDGNPMTDAMVAWTLDVSPLLDPISPTTTVAPTTIYLPALGIFVTTINGKGSVIDSIVANFGATQGTPNPLVFTKKCKRDGIDTCAKGTPPMGMTWVDNLSPDWPLHFPRRL